MIEVIETASNKYKVRDIVLSFFDVRVKDFYYDMDKLLISELPDFCEGTRTRKLSQSGVDWFNKYYKPKAQKIFKDIS